ncbi:MAG: hypothetical protein OMM_03487 [Candidatus Magnetoglobus multicellularis str. Araruama]|uniref:Uncharacterized protein n=1 Tax=Candidatus Magnetoglobus multicellularis str. Araruama TaxID=890399 RepID=A0A1V1P5D8_9BACT|nr:MAG: hypothetical protein OMM_03487 [Candidatus Magnetoglobus multicellularis str. Araruama]
MEYKDKDSEEIDGDETGITEVYKHFFANDTSGATYTADNYTKTDFSNIVSIEFPVSAGDYSFVAPDEWGIRQSPGQIQESLIELVKAEADLQSELATYTGLIEQMKITIRQIAACSDLNEDLLTLNNSLIDESTELLREIEFLEANVDLLNHVTEYIDDTVDVAIQMLPTVVGTSNDVSAPARSTLKTLSYKGTAYLRAGSFVMSAMARTNKTDLEILELEHSRDIEKEEYEYDVQMLLTELEELLGNEAKYRIAIFKAQENMRQVSEKYKSTMEKGLRLLEERQIFNQRVAAKAQTKRYKDMAYRTSQYEALQKYRAAFDLAARYVYLAAKAYDYETNLSENDPASVVSLLEDIIEERVLGRMVNGKPVIGYGGLSEILARMDNNYDVLETRMGFNNPQTETGRFSLRNELFRIKDDQDDIWRDTLAQCRVDDLWEISEFRRYCRNFAPEDAGPQPGLVITFSSTIQYGDNFFGWPLSGGDHAYDASNFSTKVRSVGIWLENYDNSALAETPRVYLIPAGMDVMYVPNSFDLDTREWSIVDQVIPVPLPVGQSDILKENWIPKVSTLNEDPTKIRRFSSFRAYHDSGYFDEDEMSYDSRLVGRSVWNTRWMLIIPGATFLNDPDDGLDTLIYGQLVPGYSDTRDENGISDIKLFFQTYAYSGN